MNDKLPLSTLYAYIYRNILKMSREDRIINNEMAVLAMRKVIHKAPGVVYQSILNDFTKMGLMEKLDKQKYILMYTKEYEKQIKKLKEYVFPINP